MGFEWLEHISGLLVSLIVAERVIMALDTQKCEVEICLRFLNSMLDIVSLKTCRCRAGIFSARGVFQN